MSKIPQPYVGYASNGTCLQSPDKAVKDALDLFEKRFRGKLEQQEGNVLRSGPMQYTVEADVRREIYDCLDKMLPSRSVTAYGRVKDLPNDYKAPYARGFTRPTEMDALKIEVNVGDSSSFDSTEVVTTGTREQSANALLDIAWLESGCSHPCIDPESEALETCFDSESEALEIAIAGGSKYFPPSAVSKAFEVKYVKDMATPGGFDDPSDPEMNFVSTWEKVRSDVKKLVELQKVSQNEKCKDDIDPDCHLIIVTHYDPFRCLPHRDGDAEETETRESSYQDNPPYPEQFEELAQRCAEHGIHVWHYHPVKVYHNDELKYPPD